MVNKLQFNLSVPTPYVFLKRFLKAAQGDNKVLIYSFLVPELCLFVLIILHKNRQHYS